MSTNNDNLISIKELAAKLKVTDALVKKLIKDFGIEPDRVQKRIHLNEDAVKTVREILALKASGKKNKEIKELFDAAQAELKTETKAVPEESKEEPKAKKEEKTISKKASPKKPKTDSKTETGSEDKPEAEVKTETKSKNPRTRKKPKAKTEELKTTKEEAPVKKEKEEDGLDITSYLDETEDDAISMAMRLADNDSPIDEEPKAEIDLDEALDLDEGEADFEELPEVVEKTGKRLNPRKMRRRQFSFRYIQRQIANDAKRVQYIQQKLERGRLSTMEEMNLKDSLEHRSKLHSGWVHLLKWVKS
ncbi:MAG: MerR family transcriptional regulator [Candidatus Melainabacteria bacterium]|jgi:hypothetical protein|nr:MerR family transcriptional regulator [Candidatus Melainabacteria bacterium]